VTLPYASSPPVSSKVYIEVIVNLKTQITYMNLRLSINNKVIEVKPLIQEQSGRTTLKELVWNFPKL
jgi:hypothetical protein